MTSVEKEHKRLTQISHKLMNLAPSMFYVLGKPKLTFDEVLELFSQHFRGGMKTTIAPEKAQAFLLFISSKDVDALADALENRPFRHVNKELVVIYTDTKVVQVYSHFEGDMPRQLICQWPD